MNLKIQGGQVLSGEIIPSGSKNSVVALIPATILFDHPVTLTNVPEIKDVDRLVQIMTKLGSRIVWNKEEKSLTLDNSDLRFEKLDGEDLGNMKGTSLLWGPMLARFGKVNFANLPGGCTLGARPLSPQYDAFRQLGIKIQESGDSALMDASQATASQIWLSEMSPTVTENVIMLATSLSGRTVIIGAASEPQVQDLCRFLVGCGARIEGIGSSIITVEGKLPLTATTHRILSDHYEIATFLAMAAATGGEIKIHDAMPDMFTHINYIFKKFGIDITYEDQTAILKSGQKITIQTADLPYLIVRAQPWPSLPVDLLPVFIPLALAAKNGQVLFHNWMYEGGLFWTSELTKMGANVIMADPHRVLVTAGQELKAARLEAPYIIRAVISLIMASMLAKGESTIFNADALYRGHPDFAKKVQSLGGKIEEIV